MERNKSIYKIETIIKHNNDSEAKIVVSATLNVSLNNIKFLIFNPIIRNFGRVFPLWPGLDI